MPIQYSLKVPVRAIWQEKKNKDTQTRKEEVKLFLFSGDTIFYTENLKGFTKNLLELINEYSKV